MVNNLIIHIIAWWLTIKFLHGKVTIITFGCHFNHSYVCIGTWALIILHGTSTITIFAWQFNHYYFAFFYLFFSWSFETMSSFSQYWFYFCSWSSETKYRILAIIILFSIMVVWGQLIICETFANINFIFNCSCLRPCHLCGFSANTNLFQSWLFETRHFIWDFSQ